MPAEDEALGGGEDYERGGRRRRAGPPTLDESCADAGLRLPVRIGSVVDDPAVRLLDGAALQRLGWQHRVG